MRTMRSDVLFQLPSVQCFLNRLMDDLANRRSLLVLLPTGVDPVELKDVIRAELWRRDFELEEVSLAYLLNPRERLPVAALSEALGIGWPSDTPRTLLNLMETEQLPDIILLDDLDQLPPATCKDWLAFLSQWAQHSQRRIDRGSSITALCVMGPATAILSHLPESSVHLAVHWWWGFPSALETRVLCRSSNEGDGWDTITRWREYVLPALSGNDVSLVDDLWDVFHKDVETLLKHLYTLAGQRGWEASTLQNWGVGKGSITSSSNSGSTPLSPPVDLRLLWAHGAVGWTLEYGIELHPVALAVLGRHDELRHRLWRGQAELLFPLVDRIRLEICNHFTHTYGSDWPVRWSPPISPEEDAAVRQSPLACQWGHLKALLSYETLRRSHQNWFPLISLAHSIRNEIAHYRPITFRDFEGFWREVERTIVSGTSYL